MTSSHAPGRFAAVALVFVVALALLPGIAAADQRGGGSVVVGPNETVEGDLDAFGGNIVVRGTVTGNLSAFGGNVRIDGTVEGDVEAAAGNVAVGPNATVGGNLEASADTVTIAGTVDGNLDAGARSVTLARTASIGGDLTYSGDLTRESNATVAGSVTQGAVGGSFEDTGPSLPGWAFDAYGLLTNAALGAVLLLVFPVFSRSLADRASESPGRSSGVGLLALVGIPVVLTLTMLTIVGLPLALVGWVLYPVLLWVAAVYGRYAVGTWLSQVAGVDNRWVGLLVGLVMVALLKRIPPLGGFVELLVVLFGLGALSMSLYGRYRGGGQTDVDAPTTGDEDATPA